MKIKILLSALCLLCEMQSVAYGQRSDDNCQFSIVNSQLYNVPPRREIRHKIKTINHKPSIPTRISGEYVMSDFPTTGEARGVVILAAFADVPFSVSADSIHELLSHRYNADDYSAASARPSSTRSSVSSSPSALPKKTNTYFIKNLRHSTECLF